VNILTTELRGVPLSRGKNEAIEAMGILCPSVSEFKMVKKRILVSRWVQGQSVATFHKQLAVAFHEAGDNEQAVVTCRSPSIWIRTSQAPFAFVERLASTDPSAHSNPARLRQERSTDIAAHLMFFPLVAVRCLVAKACWD